jgi:hypothetical protein
LTIDAWRQYANQVTPSALTNAAWMADGTRAAGRDEIVEMNLAGHSRHPPSNTML